MSSLNINYNGNSIPIADIGIVSSKEKVQLGNLERDLVLQTLGSISIQVGNKFYDLDFESFGNNTTITSNINFITSLLLLDISSYNNGDFLFDESDQSLYIVYENSLKQLSSGDSSNKIFLSFINDQTLSGEQKQRLVLNTGYYLNTLDDVKKLSKNDVFENQIVFVQDEKKHYILYNIDAPNITSSWNEIYISSSGGTISDGLIIKNKTKDNLLYLNGIDDFNGINFNGLKIGDSNIWIKQSVNTNNQSVIEYNSNEFIIKKSSNIILKSFGDNIGIGGEPSNSDKYKITIDGTTKFTSPIYTDSKIVSTDYTSTNITHWDGGKGFGLTHGSDDKWFLEVDDVLVRGSLIANKMTLKELEVERAYATGGHMLITDGANINSHVYRKPTEYEWKYANTNGTFDISTATVDGGTITNTYTGLGGLYGTLDKDSFYYFITFKESTEKDDNNAYVSLPTNVNPIATTKDESSNIEQDKLDVDKNCPFICGDVLLCQTASGLTAKKYYCLVSYSTNKYAAIKETDFRNNNIYQRDNNGNITGVSSEYGIETGDTLIRVTNILSKDGKYLYPERRRFIDVDGTRNQITMYDNMGKEDSFSGSQTTIPGDPIIKYYPDINIITGITQNGGTEQGALRLRMGRLDDLGIQGLGGYGLYADNVYLKGKLIVTNDDGTYENVGSNRGTWGTIGVTYYINDMVTYAGSVYRCILEHKLESIQELPSESNKWQLWVSKGSSGDVTGSFKHAEIRGDQVFIHNTTLNEWDKSEININCNAYNITEYSESPSPTVTFTWTIAGAISKTIVKTYNSGFTSTTVTDSISVKLSGTIGDSDWENIWGGNRSLVIRCEVYLDSLNNDVTLPYDTFSVYKIEDGSIAESVSITGNQIFKYASKDSSIPSITHNLLTAVTQNTSGYLWKYYKNNTWNSFPLNNGTSTYDLYYNDSAWEGNILRVRCESGSAYDEITISKIYDGDDSFTMILSNENQVIACDKDGNPKNGEIDKAFTLIRVYKGSTLLKQGEYSIGYAGVQNNDDYDVNTYSSSTDFYNKVLFLDISGNGSYIDITATINTITLTKRFTVIKAIDGQTGSPGSNGLDSYSAILTNESIVIPALNNGSFPSNIFSVMDFNTNIIVYKGGTKLIWNQSSGYSYTVSLVNGSRFSFKTFSANDGNCNASINSITLEEDYTPDSMYADFLITITNNGSNTSTSLTKRLYVSKSKVGDTGPTLDWVTDWNDNSVTISGDKVLSPRIFTGSYDSVNNIYTGISIGRNAFNISENGIAGYLHNNKTFHLNTSGEFVIGARDNKIDVYDSNNQIIKTIPQGSDYMSFDKTNGLKIVLGTENLSTFITQTNSNFSVVSKSHGGLNISYIALQREYESSINNYALFSPLDKTNTIGSLGDNLINGVTYTFSIVSSSISIGSATSYSIVLFDSTNSLVASSSLFQINSTRQSWTFTVPDDTNNYKILVYIGVRGSTSGNKIKYNYIQLEKGSVMSSWINPIYDQQSQIQINSDNISLKVNSEDLTNGKIISSYINVGTNNIAISASKIQLTGSTTLDGLLTAGTINAQYINVDNLTIKRLTTSSDQYTERLSIINNQLGFFTKHSDESNIKNAIISIGKDVGSFAENTNIASPGINITDRQYKGDYNDSTIYYKDDKVRYVSLDYSPYDSYYAYSYGEIITHNGQDWMYIKEYDGTFGYAVLENAYWTLFYEYYIFVKAWANSDSLTSGHPVTDSAYWRKIYTRSPGGNHSELTSDGLYSNGSNIMAISGSAGATNASIVGVLQFKNDSLIGISSAILGVDSSGDGRSQSYAGWFAGNVKAILGSFIGNFNIPNEQLFDVPDTDGYSIPNKTSYPYKNINYHLFMFRPTSNKTFYLPNANDYPAGDLIFLFNRGSGQDAYIHCRVNDTINGYSYNSKWVTLAEPGQAAILRSDGKNEWMILSNNGGF